MYIQAPGTGRSLRPYFSLTLDSTQNVYVAELFAIKIAVDMAVTSPPQYRKCVIYADSQPAIKASTSPSHQSGQSVICTVLDSIDSLKAQRPDTEISIVWIPGHITSRVTRKPTRWRKRQPNRKAPQEIHFPSTP